MPATARVTILVDPAEKRALETRAKRENVSLGELMRRAVLGPKHDEDAALRAAVAMLRKSNATAKAALDQALATSKPERRLGRNASAGPWLAVAHWLASGWHGHEHAERCAQGHSGNRRHG